MFRTTQGLLELRRWAEARATRPHREDETGRLTLSVPGGPARREVGWDEFEPAFLAQAQVCVYDDAPGACACFIGSPDEAWSFLRATASGPGPVR
jgi:hypothetical protein